MPSRPQPLPGTQPLILVVDDQEPNQRVVGALLTRAGFDVVPAMSGPEALERLRTNPPDCVLLDYQLPDLDGLEFLDRARDSADGPWISIVMLTGHGNEAVLDYIDAKERVVNCFASTVDSTISG